ncbi:PLP-dependent cysteine synthase family protein [Dinghuibacter silviterrae]|uniref:cysteine synthase n=1 Tax=Dinghuibacter silviterrae TaxID=1539049 RepID=A0A4R8DI79_9BACT|nr:PLP-dependent cysteine synthase family protein [Dinghuibacter silviterrae]TDW97267.1 cysteine synthase A [Dinghuibacter silviterrae]
MLEAVTTIEETFRPLWHLVGNTPMLELDYLYKGQAGRIYVKCEHYNLTGSVKDRMALYILYKAYREGRIQPGDTIIEATSGNTGIAFAAIGKALGHPVTIIMPNWLSRERVDIIRSLGAEVILISKEEGGFKGSIELSERLAEKGRVFLPRQFANEGNAEAHEHTTGVEIWEQLEAMDMFPDAFVAGVGTGGTVMGVGAFLKRMNPLVRIHPLEPAESPTLSVGHKVGSHRIQGISDEFIPPIVRLDELDTVVQVHDGDAILMAQKLSRQLGLAVGISSGANVIGAIQLALRLGKDATVVTLLADSNKKYLSTDLVREEPVQPGYLSTDTDFVGYRPIPRLKEPVFGGL